jgi:uncharacterized membrane protein YphA (DoxX/SURF4 family)
MANTGSTTKRIAQRLTCGTVAGLLISGIVLAAIGVGLLIIIPVGIAFLAIAGILILIGLIGLFAFLVGYFIDRKNTPMTGYCKFNMVLAAIAICLIIAGAVRFSIDPSIGDQPANPAASNDAATLPST